MFVKTTVILLIAALWTLSVYNPPVIAKSTVCTLFSSLGVNKIYVCPDPQYPAQSMYCLRE